MQPTGALSPYSPLFQEYQKEKRKEKEKRLTIPVTQNWPIYKDDTTIAMRKGTDGSQVVTILSNKGASGDSYTLSLGDTGYKAGQQLTEVIGCTTVTVGSDGKVPVPMAGGLPRVLYLTEKLADSKICSSS